MNKVYTLVTLVFFTFKLGYSQITIGTPLNPIFTDKAPILDGVLDDEVWQRSPFVTGFKTFAPDFGKDIKEQTVVYLAYDSENLYFAFKCFDTEPDKIKASIASRDNIRSEDWICINLDSYNDQQGLYAFYVNPFGIQEDSRFAANQEDQSVDYVWYSAGKLNSEGYNVEVKIPLKSIRYSDKNPVTMGVILERYISRRSEHSSYPELDPAKGFNILTEMYPVVYENVKHFKLFEILPAVTYFNNYVNENGEFNQVKNRADFSLTAKYGLTSELILDGTYNPDFSQVEADAGQVDINLRSSLYFAEKRPFFLEGRDYFNIAATSAYENDPVYSLVYTRTIYNPTVGFKLSGKVGRTSTIASIYSMDELPSTDKEYAHFTIARYKLGLAGDSFIGGVYAGRELKGSYNRLTGLDGQFRINEASSIDFNSIISYSEYADTSLFKDGYTYGARYMYQTRNTDLFVAVKDVSENFQADMGFLTRSGVRSASILYRPKFYPKLDFLRRIDVEFYTLQTNDLPSKKWETFNHFSSQFSIFGTGIFKVKYSYSTEIFLGKEFKTGGYHVLLSGNVTKKLYLGLLYRYVNSIYYSANPYQGVSNKIRFDLLFEPLEKIKAEFNFTYSDLIKSSDNSKIYEYPIGRFKFTYQPNKYLFFRGICEYNKYKQELKTDFLASFTYIPGTVIHVGYGSLYDKSEWDEINSRYIASNNFLEMQRGIFFKASYLWRN